MNFMIRKAKEKKEKRFQIVHREIHGLEAQTTVIKDKDTGVFYLFHNAGYGGGLTPLLGEDGKPLIEKRD